MLAGSLVTAAAAAIVPASVLVPFVAQPVQRIGVHRSGRVRPASKQWFLRDQTHHFRRAVAAMADNLLICTGRCLDF